MAAIILPHKWRQQPQYPLQLDDSNYFRKNLILAYLPHTLGVFNKYGTRVSLAGRGIATNVYGSGGYARKPFAGDDLGVDTGLFDEPITVISVVDYKVVGAYQTICAQSTSKTNGWDFTVNNSYQPTMYSYGLGARPSSQALTAGYQVVGMTTRVVTGSTNSYHFLQRNKIYSTGAFNKALAGDSNIIRVGTQPATDDEPFQGLIYNVLVFNRSFTDAEMYALGENPWQIYQSNKPKLVSVPTEPKTVLAIRTSKTRAKWRPTGNFEINRNHPSSLSIELCTAMVNNTIIDLAWNEKATLGGTWSSVQTKYGPIIKGDTSTITNALWLGKKRGMNQIDEWTCLGLISVPLAGPKLYPITAMRDTYYGHGYGFMIDRGGAWGSSNAIIDCRGLSPQTSSSANIYPNTEEPTYCGISVTDTQTSWFLINGKGIDFIAPDHMAQTDYSAYDRQFYLYSTSGGIDYSSHLYLVQHWSRKMSKEEYAILSENPWQIFRSNKPTFYSIPTTSTQKFKLMRIRR
jgi:hypothetical protein